MAPMATEARRARVVANFILASVLIVPACMCGDREKS